MGAPSLVPPGVPLAMPQQSLAAWDHGRSKSFSGWRVLLARFFVFSVAVGLAAYGSWQMYEVVGQRSATSLQILLVVLFAVTFSWIALSAATALLGFFVTIARRPHVRRDTPKRISARTAILMPIYNEDTDAVFQALARMATDVNASGHGRLFDIFVLSDSTDTKTLQRERAAANRLRSMLDDGVKVYYRKRLGNEAKKAGNVADFVRRWGGAYDFMIVLDADSTMAADAIITLVQAMEDDPNAGLIQTVPQLARGKTLFARLQQFAAATYGPLLAAGLTLWHGRDGNYWGHNAIIRVRAFAESCGLPPLRGGPPLGGHILSHDFVEAALLRRAGYSVSMRPDIEGSFEGTPPTLAEHAARDRRWAQGNLQHGKIVPAAGLHWMSRFHLVNGIMSYLASPLWLMFLSTGIALSWVAETVPPNYFPSDFALYPTWPKFDARQAFSLLGVSIVVLVAPKLLALVAALANPKSRRAGGGALALTGSAVLELLFSSLLAPVMMLMQSRAVMDVLLGRDAGWAPQQRREQDAPLSVIARQHFSHTLAGLALSYGTFAVSVQVWLWLLPVWLGLVLAIPLAWLTARSGAGEAARRAGLFLVAGESVPRESRPLLDEEAVPG